jgi:hypothetical protein
MGHPPFGGKFHASPGYEGGFVLRTNLVPHINSEMWGTLSLT